jgi:DNA-binding MarR family transcriptional regulator
VENDAVKLSPADMAAFVPLLNRLRALALSGQLDRLAEQGFSGLTPGTVALLPFIGPSGTRPIVLAEQAGMTRQAAGQTLREMECRGFVILRDDPADDRAKVARLSPDGEALRDAAAEAREVMRRIAVAALGPAALSTWLIDGAALAAALEATPN